MLSMYAKMLQPLDMHGFPGRKRLYCLQSITETSACKKSFLKCICSFYLMLVYIRTFMRIAAVASKDQCPCLV